MQNIYILYTFFHKEIYEAFFDVFFVFLSKFSSELSVENVDFQDFEWLFPLWFPLNFNPKGKKWKF